MRLREVQWRKWVGMWWRQYPGDSEKEEKYQRGEGKMKRESKKNKVGEA